MIRKIGILILIGIISMCNVIPIALADDNDNQNVNDEIIVDDEKGNIFTIIWDKLTSMLTFSEYEEEETTIDVEAEHPSGKTSHGAIVSLIARIINKLESVVGKTHGLIMRAVARTNWGRQIEDEDSSEGTKPTDIPPKKSIAVLETVFDRIINNIFVKQNELLYKIKDKFPEKAQAAIERAIENNKRKMQRMEEIKARVRVRVKNRNSNNE